MPARKKITRKKNIAHTHVPLSTALIALAVVAIIAIAIPLLIYARDFVPESKSSFTAPARIDGTPVDEDSSQVDPKKLSAVLNELKNLTSRVSKLNTLLQKSNPQDDTLPNEIASLKEEIAQFMSDLKNPPLNSSVAEVYADYVYAQLPESVESLQTRVELPLIVLAMEKDLKKGDMLAGSARLTALPGIDADSFKQNIQEQQDLYESLQEKLGDEDFDGAKEVLDEAHAGAWLTTGLSFLSTYETLEKSIKGMKDVNAQNSLQEVIVPIVGAFNNGAYEKANTSLAEVVKETKYLLKRYTLDKVNGKVPVNDLTSRLTTLDSLISKKLAN